MSEKFTLITDPCVVCGYKSRISVPVEGYLKWKSGMHVQDAMPLISTETRELLKTGTHGQCWDELLDRDEPEENMPPLTPKQEEMISDDPQANL